MTAEKTPDPASGLTIRPAAGTDAGRLVDFNRAMARETENRELDIAVVSAGVQAVIDEPARGFYLVAETGGAVVGALMVTYEWSDWRNGLFLWIQSVYVVPGQRGNGIYRRLYEHVRTIGRDRGDVCGFRLYVEENNHRAQRTYASLGMSQSGYMLFEEEIARDA